MMAPSTPTRTWLVAPFLSFVASTIIPPIVHTSIGAFQGLYNSSTGITQYTGIPYAQPPIGDRRFQAAAPASFSSNLRQATEWPVACPQNQTDTIKVAIDEDCLFLNVFVPDTEENEKKEMLPVVVWFYGGDFVLGDTSAYDPILILQRSMDIRKPVIFASVNYRLSALGFLWHSEITKPEDANRGITDQSLALKWLQQNLEVFGGDPEKVTIWGESAGAFSVQAHTIFGPPNLFRSSIVASGYLLKDSQYPTNDFFWQVSSGTGCGGEGEVTPQEANQCLKTVPWQTIRDVSTKLNIYPRITGSFIDRPPKERILDQEYNKVPVLIGTTRDEGSISTPEEVNSEEDLFLFINATLNKNESSARTVLDAYKNDPDLQGQTWLQLASDYIGDGYYLTDRRYEAKHLSRTQPVWTYRFDVFTPGPFADLYGVHHGSDVGYFFPNAFLQFLDTSIIGQTPELLAVRNRLLDRWIYFITEQNPNAPSSETLWNKYSESKEELIRFNTSGDDNILDDFRLDETNLLTTLIPAE